MRDIQSQLQPSANTVMAPIRYGHGAHVLRLLDFAKVGDIDKVIVEDTEAVSVVNEDPVQCITTAYKREPPRTETKPSSVILNICVSLRETTTKRHAEKAIAKVARLVRPVRKLSLGNSKTRKEAVKRNNDRLRPTYSKVTTRQLSCGYPGIKTSNVLEWDVIQM